MVLNIRVPYCTYKASKWLKQMAFNYYLQLGIFNASRLTVYWIIQCQEGWSNRVRTVLLQIQPHFISWLLWCQKGKLETKFCKAVGLIVCQADFCDLQYVKMKLRLSCNECNMKYLNSVLLYYISYLVY